MKIRPVSQRMFLCAVILTLIVVATPPGLSARGDDGRDFDHVFVIMMENIGYNTLIGNPNAPFINFAAATTGRATSYYGVTHPSQPAPLPKVATAARRRRTSSTRSSRTDLGSSTSNRARAVLS